MEEETFDNTLEESEWKYLLLCLIGPHISQPSTHLDPPMAKECTLNSHIKMVGVYRPIWGPNLVAYWFKTSKFKQLLLVIVSATVSHWGFQVVALAFLTFWPLTLWGSNKNDSRDSLRWISIDRTFASFTSWRFHGASLCKQSDSIIVLSECSILNPHIL